MLTRLPNINSGLVDVKIVLSLKQAWEVIKMAPHVADFLSWQITADLCKLKLIQLREDFVALGPGAKPSHRKVSVIDKRLPIAEL